MTNYTNIIESAKAAVDAAESVHVDLHGQYHDGMAEKERDAVHAAVDAAWASVISARKMLAEIEAIQAEEDWKTAPSWLRDMCGK